MLGGLFKKKNSTKKEDAPVYITVNLNARLQPIDRGDVFEDPLMEALEEAKLGEVCGGGTAMGKDGEITSCDIELALNTSASIDWLKDTLEKMGAPKGSRLLSESLPEPIMFGVMEGLALYMNGTELPDAVYQECDINFALEELGRLLDDEGFHLSHWEGPEDTGLYFYGPSFEEMKKRMLPFLESYPLCQKCRIEQIA